MDAFETLIPLYLTARECPQKLEKNMHQALALMIHKDVNQHKLNLENYMYFREWLNSRYYHRKSAIQTALKIRQYYRMKDEYRQHNIDHCRFWRRIVLQYRIYSITHGNISVSDILNYACYLFMNCKCGSKEDFFAFLENIEQKPGLYFK